MPVVTPPPAWGHLPVGVSYLPPTSQQWTDPTVIDNLKRQVDQLNSQLANTSKENVKLKAEVFSLHSEAESVHDVESTLIPSQVANKSNMDTSQHPG